MTTCIHDSAGNHIGQVCTGSNNRYIVRTRYAGFRTYDVKSRHRSRRAAIMAMAKLYADGRYKRVDVLLTADYYEPIQICELVQR